MDNPNASIKLIFGLCCLVWAIWPVVVWVVAHRLKVRYARRDAVLVHEKQVTDDLTTHVYTLQLVDRTDKQAMAELDTNPNPEPEHDA
jgi:hypothetical protein